MTKRIKKILITCVLITLAILSLSQSSLVKNFKAIYDENANMTEYSNGTKTIRFVDMHHFGKKNFYQNVRHLVFEAKSEGFVLFYEYMGLTNGTDTEKRKIRKLMGFIPSAEGYTKFTEHFDKEKFMVQNDSLFLNLINEKHFNIDINSSILVNEFEKRYGIIELTDSDYNIPLTESIEPSYPDEQVESVLMTFRNEYLAQAVIRSEYDKIIILYGSNHRKGFFEELKKADKNWKK